MTTMIALVGEQPLPNFLPVLHYKPDYVVLVYTTKTEPIYTNLKVILEREKYIVHGVKTGPYDVGTITRELRQELETFSSSTRQTLLFNLTGGTKTMSFAAYQIAAQLKAPVIYFQSEGGKSITDYYIWQDQQLHHVKQEEIPEYLQLKDMMDLHLGSGKDSEGNKHWEEKGPTIQQDTHSHLFEIAIAQTLYENGYEVMRGVKGKKDQLDIDVAIGYRNQVGIIEAKSSKDGNVTNLDGIKQLSTAMRYLRGTYIQQFLVIAGQPSDNLEMMSGILKIPLISLPNYKRGPSATDLTSEDKKTLLDAIEAYMKVV